MTENRRNSYFQHILLVLEEQQEVYVLADMVPMVNQVGYAESWGRNNGSISIY